MRKEKIYKCEFTNYEYLIEGENREIDLEYYMLLNDEKETYGIEILKKEKSNLGTETIEKNSMLNYTSDINRAIKIIKCLGEAKVTPISLYDVMENFEK